MVKKSGVESTVTQQDRTLEQVIAENEALLKQISDLQSVDPIAMKYMAEERAIKKSGRVDAEKIKVREITDHKNISLWTRWGKRVGPMHRDNALNALRQFAAMNISLSAQQPTNDEIGAWLDSKEGMAWTAAEDKRKKANEKTRKGAAMEKIMKQMADQYGLTMDTLKGILPAGEIKPLKEGPGRN